MPPTTAARPKCGANKSVRAMKAVAPSAGTSMKSRCPPPMKTSRSASVQQSKKADESAKQCMKTRAVPGTRNSHSEDSTSSSSCLLNDKSTANKKAPPPVRKPAGSKNTTSTNTSTLCRNNTTLNKSESLQESVASQKNKKATSSASSTSTHTSLLGLDSSASNEDVVLQDSKAPRKKRTASRGGCIFDDNGASQRLLDDLVGVRESEGTDGELVAQEDDPQETIGGRRKDHSAHSRVTEIDDGVVDEDDNLQIKSREKKAVQANKILNNKQSSSIKNHHNNKSQKGIFRARTSDSIEEDPDAGAEADEDNEKNSGDESASDSESGESHAFTDLDASSADESEDEGRITCAPITSDYRDIFREVQAADRPRSVFITDNLPELNDAGADAMVEHEALADEIVGLVLRIHKEWRLRDGGRFITNKAKKKFNKPAGLPSSGSATTSSSCATTSSSSITSTQSSSQGGRSSAGDVKQSMKKKRNSYAKVRKPMKKRASAQQLQQIGWRLRHISGGISIERGRVSQRLHAHLCLQGKRNTCSF